MHTMPNEQNIQDSLLLTERTSALWAVYGYFFITDDTQLLLEHWLDHFHPL